MSSGFDDPGATWDARFDRDDYIFGTAPNVFLAAQRPRLVAGQRALCVADGEGRNSVWLAQQGLVVSAFDVAPRGVAKARALAARCGVSVDYQVARVEDWPWTPAAFEVVAAIFVQFAPPALRERMFAGMLQTLRPGGWLLLQNLDFVRHPTAKRGEQLFYQSANYRAVLFAAIIVDVLLTQALSMAASL